MYHSILITLCRTSIPNSPVPNLKVGPNKVHVRFERQSPGRFGTSANPGPFKSPIFGFPALFTVGLSQKARSFLAALSFPIQTTVAGSRQICVYLGSELILIAGPYQLSAEVYEPVSRNRNAAYAQQRMFVTFYRSSPSLSIPKNRTTSRESFTN